jgi:hypothetical protein
MTVVDEAPVILDQCGTTNKGRQKKRIMRSTSKVLVACLVAAFPVFVAAEVVYRVIPSADRQQLRIEMSFDTSTPTVELQLPSWSPGMYSIRNSWDTLRELTATTEEGDKLAVTHTRGDVNSIIKCNSYIAICN